DDGIRDFHVTGVQTCALPIYLFDIVFVAIIAGILGARLWHVLTSPAPFFGPGGDPLAVLYIWQGGLAIYGAVAGGAVAAWLMAQIGRASCRERVCAEVAATS